MKGVYPGNKALYPASKANVVASVQKWSKPHFGKMAIFAFLTSYNTHLSLVKVQYHKKAKSTSISNYSVQQDCIWWIHLIVSVWDAYLKIMSVQQGCIYIFFHFVHCYLDPVDKN